MTYTPRTPEVPGFLKQNAQKKADKEGAVHAVVKDGRRHRIVALDSWRPPPKAYSPIRWLAFPGKRL